MRPDRSDETDRMDDESAMDFGPIKNVRFPIIQTML